MRQASSLEVDQWTNGQTLCRMDTNASPEVIVLARTSVCQKMGEGSVKLKNIFHFTRKQSIVLMEIATYLAISNRYCKIQSLKFSNKGF